ncbi:ABA INSENSITIVE GROWTH 1 [Hibiscus trionum]|uniref:ABA INSENSITIVE GROWTH 1 n=1 Tax=Hibiscus trionum TaxID=183268 RepID=A0A9W7LUU8_HIBTR|nr:ABA INSENSITIVE GROWTH 1 [Hibiscus trionum]
MEFDDICNTALGLSLGCLVKKKLNPKHDHFLPSLLSLAPSDDTYQSATKTDADADVHRQQGASSLSAAASSFSNSSVKKERDLGSDEDEDGCPRKKLRLTKEQSFILEDKFKEHTTLNPKQKQALAEQLNLRPRQVEVWFQNRRARTKLKQTEVDCELLKKCYEALTEENKRLQKEVQEFKSLKLTAPYYMQLLPAATATLTVCPCCERVVNVSENTSTGAFALEQKSHFFGPFTHPSAAC